MARLCFEFTLLPASDKKSNICGITSIITVDNKRYILPEELQSVSYHEKLMKTPTYNKVKNSLKKRYQKRQVWITMSKELKEIYMDDDGNLQFGDQFLEEFSQEQLSHQKETDTLGKMFEKLLENTQEIKQQNIKHIADKFILEKFTSKNSNASQWIANFEKECIRFEIVSDEKKIEILRLFMDRNCANWYSSMLMKCTINSEWSVWKNKFCESFVNKGWNPVKYALFFKYRDGLLLDYAIRKEKLLLDMRKSIDTGTLVDLIAAGLPEFVLNKIYRQSLKDTVDLFNESNTRSFISKYQIK